MADLNQADAAGLRSRQIRLWWMTVINQAVWAPPSGGLVTPQPDTGRTGHSAATDFTWVRP